MGNEILPTKNSFQLNSSSARIFKGPFKWKFDAKKIKYLNSPQRTFEKHILYLTNTKRSWELDNGTTETKRRPNFSLKWEIQEIKGILEQFWTILTKKFSVKILTYFSALTKQTSRSY